MTSIRDKKLRLLSRKELRAILLLLLVVSGVTIMDVVEDYTNGSTWKHIVPEVLIIAFTAFAGLFLFFRFATTRSEAILQAKNETKAIKELAFSWEQKAIHLRHGISEMITQQLIAWKLSEAEQEICFLLLKGMSIAEIANIRGTSERTIRHQASSIYSKSELAGRAQLSAYFIEDLFQK